MNKSKISKNLSFILRHKPDSIDLVLDAYGWANIDELIEKAKDLKLTKKILFEVVKTSDKQRFIIKDNKIRANQGHSIDIDLELLSVEPSNVLYHGTATKSIDSILQNGIKAMNRKFIHLSENKEIATKVGQRHGTPIVLIINAELMYKNGYKFYQSENKVWLTEYIPKEYIVSYLNDINDVNLSAL